MIGRKFRQNLSKSIYSIIYYIKLYVSQGTVCEQSGKLSRPVESCKTPRERPLVLPGGRKWYNPKDAFNEDSIAEIISSQAELINGSTLG